MKLIVGLGNPGAQYEKTRHNLGFRVLDRLADALEAEFQPDRSLKAHISIIKNGRDKLILLKPQTFMNLSGDSVQAAASFYKIPLEDILVVHDEMDFPVGRMAFLKSGSPGGHNGVASIQERFGTRDLARLRLGINRPALNIKSEDYVLQKFSSADEEIIELVVDNSVKALHDWISRGLTDAMNIWNGV